MRDLFSHGSGGWKFKIRGLSGVVSRETSLGGSHMATFLLCPHMTFPLCASRDREGERSLVSLPFHTSYWNHLNYLLKVLFSK